ncbi:hypothetical protein QQS21_006570 [Conoideocrella luteorostrata]|uniref:Protein kinase domain-containing protein n=1 Tax=Conoideocrella luteorostrata TaxID=1105319 RepID=A0AAJ0CRN9_9HYPO|nr:hypothetical protein QQS21_006570 [Conoideocrella luteorostrata]
MEPNRIWHDPVVEIYSNLITPGVWCSADGYDLANRRWYCLKVKAEIKDDQWLLSTIAEQIRQYYAANREESPWNTIRTDAQGSPVTFGSKPDDTVDRLIRKSLYYGHKCADRLPMTDTGRIEFDVDVEVMEGEIQTRETLIHAMDQIPATQINSEIARRFCLVPILAVVIAEKKPWKAGTVAGILMPYAGKDLEIIARDGNTGMPLTLPQLLDLVRGVRELAKSGAKHGDIKYWNTVLQPKCQGSDHPAELTLIDAGSEAPEYGGDTRVLGMLLLWCLENAPALRRDKQVKALVVAAASALVDGNFDGALSCLATRR